MIFDFNQYDQMANNEASQAKMDLNNGSPESAAVHASLAVAYATLAQTAATLARD